MATYCRVIQTPLQIDKRRVTKTNYSVVPILCEQAVEKCNMDNTT